MDIDPVAKKVLEGIVRHAVPFGSSIVSIVEAIVNSVEAELRHSPPFEGQTKKESIDSAIDQKIKDKFG